MLRTKSLGLSSKFGSELLTIPELCPLKLKNCNFVLNSPQAVTNFALKKYFHLL